MKIAIVNDQPAHTGMGRYVHSLYERLKLHCSVDHVYLNYPERRIEVRSGETVRVLARVNKVPLADNKPLFWMRIKEALPYGDYDLLHFANQNLAFLVRETHPSVITCHDLAPLIIRENLLKLLARKYLYSGLSRAAKIIAISQSTRRDLERFYQIPEDGVKIIYYGVDRESFKPGCRVKAQSTLNLPAGKKIILHVGTESRRKNVPNLFRALAYLRDILPEVILVRVGPVGKTSARIIKKLKIGAQILCFTGVAPERMPLFYQASQVLVLPSLYEGFGLPVVEAMACGIPVVVSGRASLPEVVGSAGVFIDPLSPLSIGKGLHRVLSEESFREELAGKGQAQAKNFSWEKAALETLKVYKEVLH
ncbi:MAG: glycosyltransferase family 4 protein [Nitrospirae bacterium]|nr:glycosyltransferase family 4 protein [Nitrospirota bacterium]